MSPRDDAPRLLHRRLGYTERADQALPREPEAISEREQQQQTRDAHERWRQELQREWGSCHEMITAALTQFALSVRVDRRTSSDLRVIERAARRVDERYGGTE